MVWVYDWDNQQLVQNVTRTPPRRVTKESQFLRYLIAYVDQIDTDSLATEVIQDLIERLDPHLLHSKRRVGDERKHERFVGIGSVFLWKTPLMCGQDGGPSKTVES